MNLANISIRQPVLIAMMILGLVIVGIIGYLKIPVDLMPDITAPIVSVTTVYPGASPDEVKSIVTEPLEEGIGSLNGVKTVTSNSSENVSSITVEFNLEYSAVQAASDVRERVAAVRGTFPNDVQDPVIQRFEFGQLPILTIAIADLSDQTKPDELRRLVDDKIKPRLDRVDGVADVAVSGGLVREIEIALKLDEMRASPHRARRRWWARSRRKT